MRVEPWQREDWVISRVGLCYLQAAFWAEIPFVCASPVLVYWAYLSFLGSPTPFTHFSVRLLFGAIGGIAAAGGLMLDQAMGAFQHCLDNSSVPVKKVWKTLLSFRIFPGPAIYFWFVYRTKMHGAGFLKP